MTPQELKASILQLAIQGKLVEQRPEEGTGEELYQQIQAEKQCLIKAGTIKKEKPLPEIAEDEILFDIPRKWCWVRLNDICEKIGDIDHSMPKTVINGIPFLSAKDIRDDLVLNFTDNVKNISLDDFTRLSKKMAPRLNDIIFSRIGTLGRVGIVQTDKPFLASYSCCVIRSIKVDLHYLAYFLQSPIVQNHIRIAKTGIGVPDLSMKTIRMLTVPFPPLTEQKRIVAKIEELLPLIDRYEQAWSKLEEFNKRFPVDMQKSILQTAIQGKLVEQRSEEGTGEELFQQIQAEKQALIKTGKIKKEKPLPEITEDEIPFDIPDGWKWVRLQEIISVLGDGIHGTPIFDETGDYYFVNGNNLAKGNIIFKADTKKVSIGEYEKYKKPLDENTILISINGTIGNYAFYAGEPIILGKSACYFSVLTGIDKEYIRHLINTKFFMDYAVKEATQTTIKNVSLKAMRMFPVPLPPLAEQKRIVAKLEEILPLCERLK